MRALIFTKEMMLLPRVRKALVGLLPLLVACSQTPPPLSLAYINSTLLMQQYHGTAAKRQLIQANAKAWEHSIDSLTTALAAQRLSPAEQEKQVGGYRRILQQKIQLASQQADQELLKEVNDYLKSYGKTKQYDFILGANESGNIVYAAPGRDLTQEVLRGLNQAYDQRQHQTLP